VDPDSGTAELHVHDLPVFEYTAENGNGAGNVSLGPNWQTDFVNATVSFDVDWSGPVTRQVSVRDTVNGFAGTFNENHAAISWSAQSQSGFKFTSNQGYFLDQTHPGTGAPEVPGVNGVSQPLNFFAQVAREQNGIFLNTGASLEPDPVNSSLTDLVVNGSPTGNNQIQISSEHAGQAIDVHVRANDFDYEGDFQTAGITRLIVNGGPGDNHIEVANNVLLPAILLGGSGNNHIEAGGGPTVLVGGAGNDHLDGGVVNDILIGGAGSDYLQGRDGSDILIAGTTGFDNNVPALIAIMSEWSRSDESYLQRVANLSNSTVNGVSPNGSGLNGSDFLNASTVHDDGTGNLLEGGAGLDWYFANLDGNGNNGILDRVTGRKPGEILTTITL
jgi:hypothetical protein